MRFARGLSFVFNESLAFFRKGWWLALLAVLPVPAYSLVAARVPRGEDARILWASVVLAAMMQAALPYCIVRFVALRHDFRSAISINRKSMRTFAPYLAVMVPLDLALIAAPMYFAGVWTSVGEFVGVVLFLPLLSPWSVTAPSGSTVIGPIQSTRLVLPHLWWAALLIIAVFLPIAILQVVANSFLYVLSGAQSSAQSGLNVLPVSVGVFFNACSNLAFAVALFVIAYKAGVRVSEDKTLASVFE